MRKINASSKYTHNLHFQLSHLSVCPLRVKPALEFFKVWTELLGCRRERTALGLRKQVVRAEVDADAAVEAGDGAVEGTLLKAHVAKSVL